MSEPIDRASYVVLPKINVGRQLAFGTLMYKRKPKAASPQLDLAHERLGGGITLLASGRVARHLELHARTTPAEDAELDQFSDGLWTALVECLENQQVFLRPAALRLAEAQTDDGFDYQAEVDKARAAELIHRRLFGDQRLSFTRFKYVEQGAHTTTLWSVIEQQGYADALVQLCGKGLYGALADSHGRYIEMTEARQLRAEGSQVNLAKLQNQLQRRLQNYVIALLALVDDDDAKSVEMIRAALRPIDALRTQLERERRQARAAASGEELPVEVEVEVESDATEAEIAELLAEEEALEAALPGVSEAEAI